MKWSLEDAMLAQDAYERDLEEYEQWLKDQALRWQITNVGNNVYIVDCGKEGYKLTKFFLTGEKTDEEGNIIDKKDPQRGNVDSRLALLEERGMIIVNTLTTSGTKGPNLVCIDGDRLSNMTPEELEELKKTGIQVNEIDSPGVIEHKSVEEKIADGKIAEIPAGDITIWDPKKVKKAMGLMFTNNAPAITIKSDNGMVGMGVLVRQNITPDFFKCLKEIMGGNITIEVVSSAMGEYPVEKEGKDGKIEQLLPYATNKDAKLTLPEYIADVAEQVGINVKYDKEKLKAIYEKYINGKESNYGPYNQPIIYSPDEPLPAEKYDGR